MSGQFSAESPHEGKPWCLWGRVVPRFGDVRDIGAQPMQLPAQSHPGELGTGRDKGWTWRQKAERWEATRTG